MNGYRLYGFELSPYSVKVRAQLRYKQLPHEWVVRSMERMPEFNQVARLPLVPCLVFPDGSAMQDSTPVMEKLEQLHPQYPLASGDPRTDFVSALIEEYADEWCNKPMFHYRWYRDVDAASAAQRIAAEMAPAGTPAEALAGIAGGIQARMVPRLPFVGSGRGNTGNAAIIEAAFLRLLDILQAHLAGRDFLFGGRPLMGDFGLYGQLKELLSDPTPGEIMRERAPAVAAYATRMEAPQASGDLEPWDAVAPGITRLLEEIGATFLPWSDANARAHAAGAATFTVALPGGDFTQDVQKYHARSLAELRRKYAAVKDDAGLRALLGATGCLRWLEG